MTKLRLGIIGLGTIYEYQLQSLEKQDDIKLIALCDREERKVLREAVKLGILPYHSIDQMLLNEEIDAILLSTPTLTHYEIGLKVLKARKHLLLEKPALLNMQELSDLYETAQRNNVKFIVAYHAAFAKDLLWFSDHYDNELYQVLGPITEMECTFYDPYLKDGNLDSKALSLIGCWVDSGINCLSVMSKLFDPMSITLKNYILGYSNDFIKVNYKAMVSYESKAEIRNSIPIIMKIDWSLGMNQKQTQLKFSETGNQILLNHSEQKVILLQSGKDSLLSSGTNTKYAHHLLADFSSQGERLSAQYDEVFQDFVNLILHNKDNYELTYHLHSLLLDKRLGIFL